MIGEFIPPSADGFAADYPATFKVTQLNLMSAEINGCQQARNKTVASGSEPFWSVSASNNTLRYQQLGEQAKVYPLTRVQFCPKPVFMMLKMHHSRSPLHFATTP
nr:hypothetical protein [Enterovibrio nigricans]